MSKSKKKSNKKRYPNQSNIQKTDNQSMNKKPEIQKTSYNNDGKKTWVRIIVLLVACAMIIGIIAMPLMSIYR